MPESLPIWADEGVPLLTVAVPSYNGRALLEVLLPSLARQSFRDFEVVVVDDASRDDTAQWLREQWPQVEIVSQQQNVGVTAALNVCARAGRGELVALFNNDLELDPACLGELVSTMRQHPQVSWAAVKLMNFRDRTMIDGAGDLFAWTGSGSRRGHGERDVGQFERATPIFGACGGAAIYRREAFDRVGMFDEAFFAFYEDVDWNLRAQLAGLQCRYVPTAVAFHMGSATLGRGLTDFTRYHIWRNMLWVIAKDLPASALARHAPQLLLGQAINLAVAIRDRKLTIWARVWRDALRSLPRVLRLRAEVQARRRVGLSSLERAIAAPDVGADAHTQPST